MRIIPKYQSGGGLPPLTIYTPLAYADTSDIQAQPQQQQQTTSAKATDNTKGQVTDKDLLEMVGKIDGLPNDMNNLINKLDKFYKLKNLFGDDGSIDTGGLSNEYLRALYEVKVAAFNKKEYDNAYTQAKANNGLSELAITDQGKVVVQDKDGNLKQLSTKEFLSSGDKYQSLTNENLLYLRAHDPRLTNSNSVLGVVSNGIGLDKITAMIQSQLANLGSTNMSTEGYSTVQGGQIQQGAAVINAAMQKGLLQDGMTVDGLYKAKLIDKNQAQQANAALSYIYRMLPSNAKALLQIKGGDSKNPDSGAISLIWNLISSKTTSDQQFSLDLQTPKDGSSSGSGKSTGSDGEIDDVNLNPVSAFQLGRGGEKTTIELNQGSNRSFAVDGLYYGLVDLSNNKGIGITNMSKALEDSGISSVISGNRALQFGDQVIDSGKLSQFVFKGDPVARVPLPTKTVNGKTVIDFDIASSPEYAKVQQEINNLDAENMTPDQYSRAQGQILRKHGFGSLVDANGLPNKHRWGLYMAVNAYGTNRGGIKDSNFVSKLDSSDTETAKVIDQAINDGKTEAQLKQNPNKPLDTFDWWNPLDYIGHDNMYSGVLYIPISENALQGTISGGSTIKSGQAARAQDNYRRLQDIDKVQRLQNAGSTSSANL